MTAITTATAIGADHGRNAASWYFDGNTDTATYAAVLEGIDAGDPAILDTFPTSPLGGEWAGSYSLADLASDTETEQDSDSFDDVCRAYEDAFYMASQGEIERAARYQLAS